MSAFWIGFIGAWVGALTVAATMAIIYRIEIHLRNKKSKEAVKEIKDIIEKLKFSNNLDNPFGKDNKFN